LREDEELLEKENQNRLISKLLKAKQEQGEQSESGPLFKLSQVATSENLKQSKYNYNLISIIVELF
jgi:hypothetical protein